MTCRFLSCEPPLSGHPAAGQPDEADAFYADPAGWLERLKDSPPAQRLVIFDQLEGALRAHLTAASYRLCNSFFHTHFPQGRVGALLLVFCHM
jgi:phosphatidylinositol glycan class B